MLLAANAKMLYDSYRGSVIRQDRLAGVSVGALETYFEPWEKLSEYRRKPWMDVAEFLTERDDQLSRTVDEVNKMDNGMREAAKRTGTEYSTNWPDDVATLFLEYEESIRHLLREKSV